MICSRLQLETFMMFFSPLFVTVFLLRSFVVVLILTFHVVWLMRLSILHEHDGSGRVLGREYNGVLLDVRV